MNKKILLNLLFAIIPLFSYGQSVMGIPFGSSYEETRATLEKRFGKYSVHEDNGDLRIIDFSMGDFKFNFGTFMFQFAGDKTYLNAASFSTLYDKSSADIAKNNRDYLYSLLKDKYADEYLEEFTNEQGFKCYKFGLNPKDPDKVLGLITLERGKGKEGKERLYLNLDYLPIHYLDKSSDF